MKKKRLEKEKQKKEKRKKAKKLDEIINKLSKIVMARLSNAADDLLGKPAAQKKELLKNG